MAVHIITDERKNCEEDECSEAKETDHYANDRTTTYVFTLLVVVRRKIISVSS